MAGKSLNSFAGEAEAQVLKLPNICYSKCCTYVHEITQQNVFAVTHICKISFVTKTAKFGPNKNFWTYNTHIHVYRTIWAIHIHSIPVPLSFATTIWITCNKRIVTLEPLFLFLFLLGFFTHPLFPIRWLCHAYTCMCMIYTRTCTTFLKKIHWIPQTNIK